MTTDNFCFYLQNRLIQTSQTGGHQYSDTSPFSIPWLPYPLSVQYSQQYFFHGGPYLIFVDEARAYPSATAEYNPF